MSTSFLQSRPQTASNGAFLRIGQIIKVIYPKKTTKEKLVKYEVLIQTDRGAVELGIPAVALQDLGGTNDYSETILEGNDFAFKGKLDLKNPPKFKNGTRVLVGFLDGNSKLPIILGAFPHHRRDWTTEEEGIQKFSEFRGLQTRITKEGALSITYKGSRKPNSEFERPETAPTKISIDENGDFLLDDKEYNRFAMSRMYQYVELSQWDYVQEDDLGGEMIEGAETKEDACASCVAPKIINSIKLDKSEKNITLISTADTSGQPSVEQILDGKNEAITMTFGSGLVVTIDGAVVLVAAVVQAAAKSDLGGEVAYPRFPASWT